MVQVSVIVPVYNCENYIGDCIRSVLDQTYSDWELLLVNDGSTDESARICYKFAEEESRIRVIEKKNGGGGGEARNVGMAHAKAPFVAFLDSDDLFKKNKLEVLMSAQQESDYDCVVTGYEEFYDDDPARYPVCYQNGIFSGEGQVRDFFVAHYPETLLGVPWNKLYRTSIIREFDLKMPKMRRLEDGIFNVEYFAHCNSLRVLDKIVHCYRESRQVEDGKLPYDFYYIMEVFVRHYYTSLKEWGYLREEYEQPMVDYFQNDFICCLENIWRPVWRKTKKENMSYMKELRVKKLVDYMVHRPCETGRYTKIAILLFRERRYILLRAFMGIKHFMKNRSGSLFYRLKERVN